MWRFYLAATVIVAAFIFAITLHRMPAPDLRISAKPSGSPSAPRSQPPSTATAPPLRGDAPWALSALPDCAHQDAERHGSVAFVRAAIPAGAQAVQGRLAAGDCSIAVTPRGILIDRGKDRLRIPAPAQLLRSGERYYLYVQDKKSAVLRVYRLGRSAF